MVAPSFQNMKQVCEPYKVGDKLYVKVEHPNTKNIRQVRWYTEIEYTKAYGRKTNQEKVEVKEDSTNYKNILGFKEGYITIFSNGLDMDNEWFRLSEARYHTVWGWYFTSDTQLPKDIPAVAGRPVRILWSQVSSDGVKPNSKAEIRNLLDSLFYPETSSEFQGSIGERIDRTLKLIDDITFETAYGRGHKYSFIDEKGNSYQWTTSAKVLGLGQTYEIRGTIKGLVKIKGDKITELTRCRVN